MNRAKIILLCVVAAITYGVLHDEVTARLCIEYFTVAHPPLVSSTSPTIIGLCWGVVATIGLGAVYGVVIAQVAHAGSEPALGASTLFRPVSHLLATMGLSAVFAGLCGYGLALHEMITIPAVFAESIPRVQHQRFLAVWFAHAASYFVGLVGGGILVFRIWRARGQPVAFSLVPNTRAAAIRVVVVIVAAAGILWIRFGRR